MKNISRRKFIKDSARLGVGGTLISSGLGGAPLIFTKDRVKKSTARGTLQFQPHFIQRGVGPHLLDWAYASDQNGDAFHSNIESSNTGVIISDTEGQDRFAIDVRWNVEEFGYIYITADNGGKFYKLPRKGKEMSLNLNYELAKSRILRNRRRLQQFSSQVSWNQSRELQSYLALADEYYEDARKMQDNTEKCAALSQKSLTWSLWASELLELEFARHTVATIGFRADMYLGCDVRHYYQMDTNVFMEHFTELFNYANLTYVVNGDRFMNEFEPQEGMLNFHLRDALHQELRQRDITVQGRSLFWFHKWVTPDWLANKSFDDLKKYVEKHTRDVVGHYGDSMYGWEIMNEIHDWANEVKLNPEQAIELTKLACEIAKDTAPNVKRIINNCCPFAEYVQLGRWSGQEACCRQRTPVNFTREMIEAGVDFDIIGQQMYFPYRDLQDTIMMIERYEQFGKQVQLTEVGTPGGPNEDSIRSGRYKFGTEPHIWHRPWDDELEAEWLEGIYTLAYSKPYIEAINWFDMMDPESYMLNGGLLRTRKGGKKPAYHRLKKLQNYWKSLE
ncbi:MAG: endo-1,4-beta-xylanase [Candidatus Marinimicrobia bacterium]|nr:endo-1,4-beta-xylanase [Candidatus Neomarinimicrobiota bacterium]